MKRISLLFIGILTAAFSWIGNSFAADFDPDQPVAGAIHIYGSDSAWGWTWDGGVVIDEMGTVLTSFEAVAVVYNGEINFYDRNYLCPFDNGVSNCSYYAEVVAYNEDLNLALLKPVAEVEGQPSYTVTDSEVSAWTPVEGAELGWEAIEFSELSLNSGDTVYAPYFENASEWSGAQLSFWVSSLRHASGLFNGLDWFWTLNSGRALSGGYYNGPVLDPEGKMLGFATEGTRDNIISGYYPHVVPLTTINYWLDLVGNDSTEDLENYAFFSDVDFETNNVEAIAFLKSENIIQGYSDGSFQPDQRINRAEFLKIIVEAADYKPDDSYSNCFPDVQEEWFAPYVCFAAAQGWVEGFPEGDFRPAKDILKVEAMKVMLEVFEVPLMDVPDGTIFFDFVHDQWWSSYVYTAKWESIMDLGEFPQYYFPANEITRGEVSDNIFRLLNYYYE